MANEVAAIIELLGNGGDPIRYTCATAIPKGTLLKITTPRTVAAQTTADTPIAGIAAMETDGTETSISVYTNGIFDMYSAAGFAVGVSVAAETVSANGVIASDANDWLRGSTVGQALETAGAGGIGAVRVLK